MNRIVDIFDSKLMIVSDIHGNKHDFDRVMNRFYHFKKKGEVDQLVFLGDIVHSFNYKKDASIDILNVLIEKGANEEGSGLLCLLGNHELVHLFHIPLRKGNWEFNKGLEWKMAKEREKYHRFFCDMPIALRTQGGVLINHTGAGPFYNEQRLLDCGLDRAILREWDYQGVTDNLFSEVVILQMSHKYQPELGYQLMETRIGEVLWETFMNGNELQYDVIQYERYVSELLNYHSWDRLNTPMQLVVSGHIGEEWGASVVGEKQLRICSSAGCPLDLEKKVLIVEAQKEYLSMDELKKGLKDVF